MWLCWLLDMCILSSHVSLDPLVSNCCGSFEFPIPFTESLINPSLVSVYVRLLHPSVPLLVRVSLSASARFRFCLCVFVLFRFLRRSVRVKGVMRREFDAPESVCLRSIKEEEEEDEKEKEEEEDEVEQGEAVPSQTNLSISTIPL